MFYIKHFFERHVYVCALDVIINWINQKKWSRSREATLKKQNIFLLIRKRKKMRFSCFRAYKETGIAPEGKHRLQNNLKLLQSAKEKKWTPRTREKNPNRKWQSLKNKGGVILPKIKKKREEQSEKREREKESGRSNWKIKDFFWSIQLLFPSFEWAWEIQGEWLLFFFKSFD